MPAPLHATLSSYQRGRLYKLRRDPTLKSRERDRVEALWRGGRPCAGP